MILADKRDYKNGYKKHYTAYNHLKKNNDSIISRCLLLIYSAECGLKCLLLNSWQVNSPKRISENKEDKRYDIIKTHNIDKILLALGQPQFRIPQIISKHGDNITADTYHQLFRYGIEPRDRDKTKIEICEETLLKIINFIEKEI